MLRLVDRKFQTLKRLFRTEAETLDDAPVRTCQKGYLRIGSPPISPLKRIPQVTATKDATTLLCRRNTKLVPATAPQ
jgi:hypothetical protein